MSARYTPDDDPRGGEVVPINARRDPRPAVPDTAEAATPPAAEVTGRVIEGRIVPRPQLSAIPGTVIRVIAAPATARHVGRHGYYVAAGMAVTARRWRDSSTTATYQRWMRMAEATGNHEQALEWEARLAAFRRDRQARRRDRMETLFKTAVMLPKAALGGAVALAGTSVLVAIGTRNVRNIVLPTEFLAHVTDTAYAIVATAWGPVMIAAPVAALAALWHVGRRHALSAGPAGWSADAGAADADITIDESAIARALQALAIKGISDYLKEGLKLQFIVPCRTEGRGTGCVIRLPGGVMAEQVAKRRGNLASSLYRQAKEVWATTGSEEGILVLWIADKGALAEGAGPYPLLEDGFTDVFKGVPFGKTLRGDPLRAPLMGRNTIVGGIPEQGKSSAARVLMVGAALDPTAELRIYVPDSNYDFEVMRPRCSRYEMGADDAVIERIRDDLAELEDEIQERGKLLVKYQVPEVTRELASAGVGLHPVFVLLEEAHVAIQHPEYGKEISKSLVNITKLDRKRGIHLIVSTQAPTKDSMPRDVTRNCSNGIAFAVGDVVANNALLGDGAHGAGHRATELIPGADQGTALVKGFTGARSERVQAHFLSVRRDRDQVTPLIERVLAEIERRGRAVPGADRERPAIEARDLLADLGDVLGGYGDGERVRLSDLPALLRDLAPGWTGYRALNATQLRALLEDAGVRVTNTGNIPRLDPADLRRALADRDVS
jgi:DNA segregation ATPase FtsK/SpoIIIE, S-DNA-T family